MVVIDRTKIRHVTEPGYFGDMSQDYDCIKLDYAEEIIRSANREIEELTKTIAEMNSGNKFVNIPLTERHVLNTVLTFTRLPYHNALAYAHDIFTHQDSYSCHFINQDGVWLLDNIIKIKDCDVATFIRNFKSVIDFSETRRMPRDRFAVYIDEIVKEFKETHGIKD